MLNGCKGLGALSEELLEASQYYVRYDREHLAFQGDFFKNLVDTMRARMLAGDLKLGAILNEAYRVNRKDSGQKPPTLIYTTDDDVEDSIEEMLLDLLTIGTSNNSNPE